VSTREQRHIIIRKLQKGVPLSALERDRVIRALRRAWFAPKEFAAFLRQAELTQIAHARELLKHAKKIRPDDPDEWIRDMTGRKSVEAVKQFEKRERKRWR
jgi:hypothetical protein